MREMIKVVVMLVGAAAMLWRLPTSGEARRLVAAVECRAQTAWLPCGVQSTPIARA